VSARRHGGRPPSADDLVLEVAAHDDDVVLEVADDVVLDVVDDARDVDAEVLDLVDARGADSLAPYRGWTRMAARGR
jgi:hypothetical protein